ncbi:MAG: TIGR04282 family arsenosugar biosynthesis glycosyltransferase [Nitrospirae bacterium]|nr:TIGR04282 family arsenosugar biosynthesis glycosyltransferase [Nitrospirota bacterium]
MKNGLLLIFAKAPLAGYAKRRLIPALGADKAALLHGRLIEQTLATVAATGIPVELWCAPDASHPFFAGCIARYPITLRCQAGRDLGERMHHAFIDALGRSPWAVLIGCDSPALTPEMLIKSSQILEQGCDAVIGPAEDGGYYLIGLRRPEPSLFHDIPWGTGVVLEQTRERLRTLRWEWQELPPLWDLDRPDDLSRLGRTAV